MERMMSIHINANYNDFSDTVLMPGDPLRAKYISERFLVDSVEICNVRNMLGYTGKYKGNDISVMAHGMGIPSISIYLHELIESFNVKNIIRIGSCGAISENLCLEDIIVATGAGSSSAVNKSRFGGYDYAATPDFKLVNKCWEVSKELNINTRFGNTFTNDLFYDKPKDMIPLLEKMNILGVDMETSELYTLAAMKDVRALSILTSSIHLITGEELKESQSEASFNKMIELALETAISFD